MAIAVLIMGMHRSGTSATAGALSLAGVDLGRHLTPARPENPRGFFEDDRVWRIHEGLLDAIGVRSADARALPPGWQGSEAAREAAGTLRSLLAAEFGAAGLWGVKDPRLCRTFPLWPPLLADLGAEPRALLVLRDPRESARSLQRGTGMNRQSALALWLRYTLEAEAATRGVRRAIALYSELLRDPGGTIGAIERALGLGLGPGLAAREGAITAFLDADLRHQHAAGEEEEGGALGLWCAQAYAALARPREGSAAELAEIAARLDALEAGARAFTGALDYYCADWRRASAEAQKTERELAGCRAELRETREELARAHERLAAMRASRSWRLTAGLRRAGACLRATLGR